MGLDIRWPMGLLLLLLGVILAVWGIVSDPSLYSGIQGTNVNLWWGVMLVVVGSIMLALAKRAAAR
jgi:multisubunit Na+/H+ antiporter MnhG subunit